MRLHNNVGFMCLQLFAFWPFINVLSLVPDVGTHVQHSTIDSLFTYLCSILYSLNRLSKETGPTQNNGLCSMRLCLVREKPSFTLRFIWLSNPKSYLSRFLISHHSNSFYCFLFSYIYISHNSCLPNQMPTPTMQCSSRVILLEFDLNLNSPSMQRLSNIFKSPGRLIASSTRQHQQIYEKNKIIKLVSPGSFDRKESGGQ